MSLKKIRELTVGSKIVYETAEMTYDGEKVIFKQPSRREYRDLLKKATVDGELDVVSFQIWLVIFTTHDEEGNRVFSEEDFAMMIKMPPGGFIDKFAEVSSTLLGEKTEGKSEA